MKAKTLAEGLHSKIFSETELLRTPKEKNGVLLLRNFCF